MVPFVVATQTLIVRPWEQTVTSGQLLLQLAFVLDIFLLTATSSQPMPPCNLQQSVVEKILYYMSCSEQKQVHSAKVTTNVQWLAWRQPRFWIANKIRATTGSIVGELAYS